MGGGRTGCAVCRVVDQTGGQALSPWAFLLALTAAIVYPFSILLLKRAMVNGASSWQVNFYSNVMMALVTQPIWFLLREPRRQIFAFAALRSGDVSIATPLLGTKVILVALLAPLVAFQALRPEWLFAAALCSIGIFLVSSAKHVSVKHSAVFRTALLSLAAASAYATTDVLIQRLVEKHNMIAFVPLQFGTVAVLSIIFYLPIFGFKILPLAKVSRTCLLSGTFILGLQAAAVCMGIALFRDATTFNIVYNTRSIFSVVLIGVAGYRFGLPESKMESKTLRMRLLGSTLVFASVVLVMF
ncbi:MAG: hypothetical protein ABI615_02685 [Chthoniobacterales bacterium]